MTGSGRGIRKDNAKLDAWLKELALSTELRKWFEHDPEKWPEFQRRYRAELNSKTQLLCKLVAAAGGKDITLVYASRERRYNNVALLKELLEVLVRKKNHT